MDVTPDQSVSVKKKSPRLTPQLMWTMLRETGEGWIDDKASRLGAALAFYSLLSLGPLLLIVISLAGIVFGERAVEGYIFAEIRGLVGDLGAQAIQTLLVDTSDRITGFWAALIGVVMLIVSATGFFAQLQDALNTVWNVEHKPARSLTWFVKRRLLTFAMILVVGLLLLISLVLSAILSALSHFMAGHLPVLVLQVVNFILSLGVMTLLFAMVYKVLPDVDIEWGDVIVGAGITALLFAIGKALIGLYLGQSAFSSAYGAAGSLIVLLVWVYYSAQIFFIGAEFTQVWSRHFSGEMLLKRTKYMPFGSIPLKAQVWRRKKTSVTDQDNA